MLKKLLVCFIASAGAGIGTGFAGMSAATVISPMLVTFLGMESYEAVGIALASDVLASAVSAYTYHKNKNLDIKHGIIMMISVVLCTLFGSYIASLLPDSTIGNITVVMTFLLGAKFLIFPVTATRESMDAVDPTRRVIESIVSGICVGLTCGLVGAGGGMMMLFVLTTILGYELKTAVGTSVFIMTFTAFTGSASHFVLGGMPDVSALLLCVLFTFIWARLAAKVANNAEPVTLNRITGIVLMVLGLVMIVVNFL